MSILIFLKELSLTLQQNHDRLEDAQDLQRESSQAIDEPFSIGDTVLVKTHLKSSRIRGVTAKLVPKRDGIYIISRVLGPTT